MVDSQDSSKRWVISTREETREAVIAIAKQAKRKVSIFTHDLEPGIYDDPDFLEIIKHLVLSQTYARIRVLIADPKRAIKNGNNFVHLGRLRGVDGHACDIVLWETVAPHRIAQGIKKTFGILKTS